MSKTDQHQELFKRFGIAFMKKNVEAVAECLSADFVWSMPDGNTFEGKETALDAMRKRFADANGPVFSDSTFEFYGDRIVQTYQVKVGGKQLAGADIYEVSNGLISRKDAYWKQLG